MNKTNAQRESLPCGREGSAGVTLIEMLVAVTILTVVMGTLFGLAVSFGDTAQVERIKANAFDEARRAMLSMVRDVRQASGSGLSTLPAPSLTYQMAADIDGNGTAVDVSGNVELGPSNTILRDVEDLNGDGLTSDQLVVTNGNVVAVLANGLMEDEDVNGDGVFDEGEDTNGNGVLDHGIWFERSGGAVRITLQTGGETRQGHELIKTLSSVVQPRN